MPPLPNSSIPHLQSFLGHGYLAKAIIPGRPVEIVSIIGVMWTDFDEIIAIFKSIIQSTKPICDLSLPWMRTNPEIISVIYTYFPNLEHLRLGFGVTPEDIHDRRPIPPYMCSEYSAEEIDDTEPMALSQTSLSSSQSTQSMITTQHNVRNGLRCDHNHEPFPYAYVVRIQYDKTFSIEIN